MTLREYLDAHGMSVESFADALGVAPQTVYRYLDGSRLPRDRTVLRRIADLTQGNVQPNDFFLSDAAALAKPGAPL